MADDVFVFDVTTNAGVTKASPTTTQLAMPVCFVRKITVRMPPGPAGHVGFQLGAAGQQIIPANAGAWVVADNEPIPWNPNNTPQSGAWECFSYNTGVYVHTFQVRFEVDYPWLHAAQQVRQPLNLEA